METLEKCRKIGQYSSLVFMLSVEKKTAGYSTLMLTSIRIARNWLGS